MRYLALIYGDESRWAGLSEEDREREMGEYIALSQADVRWAGTSSTRSRRPRPCASAVDETLVTDGPFAETEEVIGGYYVFECDTIDEACTWAAKIPAARHGAVEVRPVTSTPTRSTEEAA